MLVIEPQAKMFQVGFQADGTTILDREKLDPALKSILEVVLNSNERVEMTTRAALKAFYMKLGILKDDVFNVLFNILFPIFLCTPRKELSVAR